MHLRLQRLGNSPNEVEELEGKGQRSPEYRIDGFLVGKKDDRSEATVD
jgi:hypothetical protein